MHGNDHVHTCTCGRTFVESVVINGRELSPEEHLELHAYHYGPDHEATSPPIGERETARAES